MQEFTTVSASSYDPAALATKLTEKAAEGWSVAGIVSTGGDVTAFLSRDKSSSSTSTSSAASTSSSDSALAGASTSSPTSSYASSTSEPPKVTEPAGWGAAPSASSSPMAPIADTTGGTSLSSSAPSSSSYAPAAGAYNPAPAASPAVPAGWYADPAGRFELRYWDGSTWTEHVSRAGQQYTDPPVA
jgi:hypothetical protein